MPSVDFQLEREEYVKASVAASALSRKGISWTAAVLVGVTVLAVLLAVHGEDIRIAFAVCGSSFVAAVGVILAKRITLPRKCRRVFDQTPTLQRPLQLTWDERTLTAAGQHGSATFPWAEFHKTCELAGHFLVFFSEARCMMVPKRAFPDEATLQDFRDCIQTHVRQRIRD